MFVIIEAPKGKAMSLVIEIEDMKRYCRAICGTKNSSSGVLLYINRIKADEIIYLLDFVKINYAITSHGIMRRNGDHIIMEYPYFIHENDDPEWIELFVNHAKKQIRNNEIIKSMLGA